MDLALALHVPDRLLAETLTEIDFSRWYAYAKKRMLPQRSAELYMAQVSMHIATAFGGATDVRLSDFLFDEQLSGEVQPDPEDLLEMAKEAFDFKPRNVKKE